MDVKLFIKDIVTFNKKPLLERWYKLQMVLLRFFILSFKKNYGNGKKLEDIPVIINNRNRITYLLELIKWLETCNFRNIHIIDNDSTYPPLIEFYSKTNYKVYRLNENEGHLALWKTDIFNSFKNDYFIYTDPDVVPDENCPHDAIHFFMLKLKKFKNIDKIGFGLRIDDLPVHYSDKQKVIDWEKKFWSKQIERDVYDADIDTTFALYKPYSNGFLTGLKSYRTGGKYIARHLPWYENSLSPDEENIFYKNNVRKGASHWIQSE